MRDLRWRSTWSLGVGQLAAWGTLYYAYAVLAPSISGSLGVSRRTLACAFSLTLLVSGVLARPVGRRLDRSGARPVLLAGALLAPLSLVALGGSVTLAALWIAFVALGAAQALSLYEPAFRAVVAWFPVEAERGRALLLVTSLGALASTVFVPLTASLVVTLGWRAATFVLAGLLAVVTIPTALALPAPPALPAAAAGPPATHAPLHAAGARWTPTAGARWLALAFGAHAFASAAVAVALIWHLVESGEPLMRAALLAGLAGAAQLPGRLLTGLVIPHVDDAWRLPLNFGIQAVGLSLVAFADGAGVTLGVICFGAASGAMTLERATLTAKWFGAARFGAVSGHLAAVGLVGRAVAPFAVEFAHARVRYGEVLAAIAFLLAAAGLTVAFAHRDSPLSASRSDPLRRPSTRPSRRHVLDRPSG